jgi:hypothetical protein
LAALIFKWISDFGTVCTVDLEGKCWIIDEHKTNLITARGQFACYGPLIELKVEVLVTKTLVPTPALIG